MLASLAGIVRRRTVEARSAALVSLADIRVLKVLTQVAWTLTTITFRATARFFLSQQDGLVERMTTVNPPLRLESIF